MQSMLFFYMKMINYLASFLIKKAQKSELWDKGG